MSLWDEIQVSYCERTTSGFMAEPFNALSALTFLLGGILLLNLYARRSESRYYPDWDIMLLIGLVFLIGVGSFLWHTVAVSWARMLDAIPVMVFMNIYLLSFLDRIVHVTRWEMFGWLLLFFAVVLCTILVMPAGFLNGSLFYLPAWMTLFVMTLYLVSNEHSASRLFVISLVVFSISVVLRTIDTSVCVYFPVGTHFFWHLLCAYFSYQLVKALIVQPQGVNETNQPVLNDVH